MEVGYLVFSGEKATERDSRCNLLEWRFAFRALSFARALHMEVDRGSTHIALRYDSAQSSLTSLFSCCVCLRVEHCALATKSAEMETSFKAFAVSWIRPWALLLLG